MNVENSALFRIIALCCCCELKWAALSHETLGWKRVPLRPCWGIFSCAVLHHHRVQGITWDGLKMSQDGSSQSWNIPTLSLRNTESYTSCNAAWVQAPRPQGETYFQLKELYWFTISLLQHSLRITTDETGAGQHHCNKVQHEHAANQRHISCLMSSEQQTPTLSLCPLKGNTDQMLSC